MFLWLGYKGIRNCLVHGHDKIFIVSYFGYLIVGAGSTAFHATLKCACFLTRMTELLMRRPLYTPHTDGNHIDPMQLVDELSMIYTTCIMVYASFSYSRSPRFSVFLGIGLTALAAFITVYYHKTKDPLFHQNSYAILTATVRV